MVAMSCEFGGGVGMMIRAWCQRFAVLAFALAPLSASAGQVKPGADGHAMNPVWSLDGKFIAFELNTFGGDGISMFFAEIAGENAKSVQRVRLPGASGPFSGQQVVMNAAWHPQGLAVFEGSNSGGKFRLYFAQPGGAMAAEMLSNQKAPGNLQFPVISSNGNLLGFVSDQFGKGDVLTWDRSTDQIRQLTKTPDVSEAFPYFHDSDGRLTFMRKSSVATIHEVDPVSGADTLVARGNGDQTRPIYAGDKVLYFTSERGDGKWDLAMIQRDGSGKKILARDVKLPERARPAVSADGKFVAYVSADPTKDQSVRILPLAGGAEVEIKTEFTACGEPAIGVHGGRYLLAFTALPSDNSDWRFLYIKDVSDRLN
jgi:Tol biopolymer transport system component